MSSTSNIQNLLVNVFRPTVAYDPSTGYVPKLNICNVDTISARSLAVTTFGLGDSNGNIFIGSNAGGGASNTNNTVIGVTAGSGMANSSSCVYVGSIAGIGAQGASNVVSIGKEARGAGISNIYIGSETGSSNASSTNNILIGHGLNYSNQVISNTLQIGKPGSLVIQGDLANKRVGINTAPSYGLDVCGSFSFHDSNGNFTYALDGTGNTQVDFRSSNVGKKAILNVVGDVYATTFFGNLSGGIFTSSVEMGKGSISAPSYSFSNDTSTGFYYSEIPPAIGTTVRGCNSMFITTTGVGIGTTTPTSALDVSGILTAPSIVTANFIRNALTPTTWDISGGNISNSATTRSSNFITATASSNSIGGVVLSNFDVRAGNPALTTITSVLELGGGYNLLGGAAERSTPAIAFQYGANTVGGYRHFIRSRHNGAINDTGNAIDFFTNNGVNDVSSSAPGVNNVLAMSVTSAGVGIGTPTPSTALDVSGNIRAGSGTVSVPSYAFSTDASLGLYRVGANQIGFTSAGVQRMVLSNSNVGINNPAPQTILDISSSTSADGILVTAPNAQLRLTNSTTVSDTLRIINGGSSYNITTTTSNPFYITQGGGQPQITLSNSRFGIGTTTPTFALDVCGSPGSNSAGAARITNTLMITNKPNTGTTPISGIRIFSDTSAQYFQYGSDISSSGTGTATLNFTPLASTTPILTLHSNQFVGIRTLAPATALDVSGTTTIRNGTLLFGSNGVAGTPLIATSGFPATGFYFASDAQPAVCQGAQEITRWNGSGMYTSISGTTTTPSIGWTQDTFGTGFSRPTANRIAVITGGTERMTISGERVGIGTTVPTQRLDVSGNIRSVSASNGVMALFATSYGNYLHIGAWNEAGSTSSNIVLNQFGGNVGIGISAPSYRLDVSGGVSRIFNSTSNTAASNTLIVQNNFLTGSNSGGEYMAGNILLAGGSSSVSGDFFGVRVGAVVPAASFQDNMRLGLFTPRGANDNTSIERLTIRSGVGTGGGGFVGIGTVLPAYQLDVSAAPTGPSINMSTWPRTNSSNTALFIRGTTGGNVGNVPTWNSPLFTVDSNLGTWSNDATNGSWFQVKRNGIWSITSSITATGGGSGTLIDLSTNVSNTTIGNTRNLLCYSILASGTGIGATALAYTGFLPSNAYVKIYQVGGYSNTTNSTLSISFLYETPATVTAF